jgi:hypothetical protein
MGIEEATVGEGYERKLGQNEAEKIIGVMRGKGGKGTTTTTTTTTTAAAATPAALKRADSNAMLEVKRQCLLRGGVATFAVAFVGTAAARPEVGAGGASHHPREKPC